jgi:hypothetical protein
VSEVIEKAKQISDEMLGTTSRISSDLKEIIISIHRNKTGVIIELPWECEVNGKYEKSITVLATKVTKENIYFINPVKVSLRPCYIKAEDKKGFPRRIEENGLESIAIIDLLKTSKSSPIYGIIR